MSVTSKLDALFALVPEKFNWDNALLELVIILVGIAIVDASMVATQKWEDLDCSGVKKLVLFCCEVSSVQT